MMPGMPRGIPEFDGASGQSDRAALGGLHDAIRGNGHQAPVFAGGHLQPVDLADGGPEFAGALVCFAYYCVAASTTYGSGYQQPIFTDDLTVEERDRETGVVVRATNTGGRREIAAKISATLPKIGLYESSERVLGTTVGIRGLGMPAPSTFAFDVDPSGRRAGLAAWRGTARGTVVTELAPTLRGSRIRAYGALDLHGSDGSRGRAEITREGIVRVEVRDPRGSSLSLNAPLK